MSARHAHVCVEQTKHVLEEASPGRTYKTHVVSCSVKGTVSGTRTGIIYRSNRRVINTNYHCKCGVQSYRLVDLQLQQIVIFSMRRFFFLNKTVQVKENDA